MRQSVIIAISNQSAAGSLASAAIPAMNLFQCSVQAVATSTVTGTLKLQFSNDICNPVNPEVPTHWSDIPSATVSIASAGVYAIPKTDLCYENIRAVYTVTSGTGNLAVNIKVLGE